MTEHWRQTVLLGRTFFGRLFESELMPPGLPQVQLVIGGVVILTTPAMIIPMVRSSAYAALALVPGQLEPSLAADRLILVTFAMITMGFISLMTWDGVFPDRRDARILGPLPLATRTLVLARLGALAYLLGLFVTGTQLLPALLFEIIAVNFGSPGGMVRSTAAHVVMTATASAFIFFALIALQCALLLALRRSAAQRAAVVVQTVLATLLLLMLFLLPQLASHADAAISPAAGNGFPLARLFPPFWFGAVYQVLGGSGGADARSLALFAFSATAGTTTLAILLYAASYARLTRHAMETPPGPCGRGGRLSIPRVRERAMRLLCGFRVPGAVCLFTLRTLIRSRQHRMLLALYLAVALALVVTSVVPLVLRGDPAALATPSVAIASAPLVLSFFLLLGMRALFAIPIEPKANWCFRLREPASRRQVVAGVRRAMIVGCVLPLALVAGASAGVLWGVRIGTAHAVFCALMGTALTEVLLSNFCKLPFTCTYFPGTARVMMLWPAYLFALTTYSYTAAELEMEALQWLPEGYLWMCGLLLGAIAALEIARARTLASAAGLVFEETDPDAMFAGFSLSEADAANSRPVT